MGIQKSHPAGMRKFYASVRMEIRAPNSDMIKEEGEGTGKRVKVKVVKNKVAIPYRTAECGALPVAASQPQPEREP